MGEEHENEVDLILRDSGLFTAQSPHYLTTMFSRDVGRDGRNERFGETAE